jgi:hypothetical protein
MNLKPSRSFLKKACLLCGSLFFSILLLEIILQNISPQQWIFPVSDWDPQYGVIAYPDKQIVNAKPGHFRFVYTTNEHRLRGKWISPETTGAKVLLLGDSNVFGFGVQDEETIDSRFNVLTGSNPHMINLGNGGWSLPQSVRRYLDLGRQYAPSAAFLHMAGNDLEDRVYGINWVTYAMPNGSIAVRDIPGIPASGRIRKIFPPNGVAYKTLMTSQLALRLKGILNKRVMLGLGRNISSDVIQPDQVVVHHLRENEARYAALLRAFAEQLQLDGVRFFFVVDEPSFYGSEVVRKEAEALARERLLELHFVHDWFVPGKDLPKSLQGHYFGAEACETLAVKFKELLHHERVKVNQ